MAGNSFGTLFRITTFGESHGPVIGCVIDGCPAGLEISEADIQVELDRRRPGQSEVTTPRDEEDKVEIMTGVFEGVTTGMPIMMLIKNKDYRSQDYSNVSEVFRPSHADFVYQEKYGVRDYRGGGRSSARETACRVAAGALAKKFLQSVIADYSCTAFVSQVGDLQMGDVGEVTRSMVEANVVRCPDGEMAEKMIELIKKVKSEGDTVGGVVSCVIKGLPVGLGEPVFDRLNADLAKAMVSINAVKGFELGSGFGGVVMKGSEHNDAFYIERPEKGDLRRQLPHSLGAVLPNTASSVDRRFLASHPFSGLSEGSRVRTRTNNSGGIQAGISNGEDVRFRVAFKPVATVMKEQDSVSVSGEEAVMRAVGRHDPCVVPRAVVIVESMANLVIADHFLRAKVSK